MDKNFFEALIKGLGENRSNYDKAKLEKLANSNDPNDKETLNSTVIDILESDDTIAIEVLLNQFNVNSKDFDGKTCLSIAASAGSIKMVKLLLGRMKAADVRKYNNDGLLDLEFPKILPNLWLVEDIISIVNLLTKKKVNLTLEHKLAILEFLVHNTNNCDCGDSELNRRELQEHLDDLITYGSAVHVNKVISKLREQIASEEIKLDNCEFIDYVGRPLSVGVMLQLYVDKDVYKVVDDIETGWENYFPCNVHHADELKLLKDHKLQKNNRLQSLLDLLAKDPRETYHQICKLNFHQICQKYSYAANYIKGLIAKSLIRHQVEEFLPDFMKALFPPLVNLCFDKVLYYLRGLSNEDILSMCQATVAKEKIAKV